MRALLSVSDKSGIVEFAQGLEKMGWEIISTGGTYKKLNEAGVKVIEIDEVTKFPECFEGRVKTLNPFVHGGILHKRADEGHVAQAKELGVEGKKDNLSLIKGIGPVVEKKLNKLGIYHLNQIASWNAEEQAWIDEQILFPRKVEREECK